MMYIYEKYVCILITQLTSGFVKADDEMRLLYADCLSELGAIDPGKKITVLPGNCIITLEIKQ